jgi:DNA polymerase I-like protein with 3'-5' exonuclease and polymerase domains
MMPPEYVGAYAEGDVTLPRTIFQEHQSKIFDKEDLWDIFKLESSLIPILLRMRIHGIAVDLEAAEKLKDRLTGEIDHYSAQIKKYVGFEPNVDSSTDLAKAYQVMDVKYPEFRLFEKMLRTAKGNPSFVAEWYAAQQDPLSRTILRKKKLATLRDDFVVGDILGESVNGRIHAQFTALKTDDGGTRDGRFASSHINLQQIPARHNEDLWDKGSPNWAEEVRKLFVADEGKIFSKNDYQQQEPRLTLHFAYKCGLPGAAEAVEIFRKDPRTDYHQMTTDIVNEKSHKSFKRKQIKSVNLALIYGAGLRKLCAMLNVTMQEGQEILTAHSDALPFVKALSRRVMATATERGFVLTLLKRRCRYNLWEPVPENNEERQFFKTAGLTRELAEQRWPGRRLQRSGLHKALNRLIQPSAADQSKQALHDLYYEHRIVPQLLVHDEIDGSVEGVEEARTYKRAMENAVLLEIPVICDSSVGRSWGEATEEVTL